jgi:RHS repeat-associated protein
MKAIDKNVEVYAHAGSIPNQCSVSTDGHGMCSIPIAVPPGTNKLQPKLSLLYASDHENSLLGIGWRLTGLSAITRVGQTMAQDNNWTAVNYTNTDRFELDGQRIMLSSLDSEQDTYYHTEIESWLKIVPESDGSIDGPSGFTVTTKDGKIMQYGMDSAQTSRIMAVGKNAVRVWALNQIEDQYGNYMTISYINDYVTGSYIPDKIEYTGNKNANITPQRSVSFGYEDRSDTINRYQGGCAVTHKKRLKTITTFLDGNLILTYTLDYHYGERSGFSQLASVTLTDAKGVSLPATSFEWQTNDTELFKPAQVLTSPTAIPYQPVQSFTIDVNGNGLNDLVLVWSDSNNNLSYAILFSNLDGFGDLVMGNPTQLSYYGYTPGLQTVDINGDGRGDLVYFFLDDDNNLNYATFISNGKNFEVSGTLQTGLQFNENPRVIPMDISGNGSSDIVIPFGVNGFLSLQVLLSNGSEYHPNTIATPTLFPILDSIYEINLMPVNITGSPMQDLIYSYWDNGMMYMISLISNGTGFIPSAPFSYPLTDTGISPPRLIPINLNGDGLSDIALSRQTSSGSVLDLFISDGIRICAPVPALLSFTISNADGFLIPMDMTGDGRLDLLHVRTDFNDEMFEIVPYLCKGQTFEAAPALPKTIPASVGSINSISLDGSGKTGMLYINNPINNGEQQPWSLQLIKAGDGYPGLIKTINNGIGGQYSFTYDSLASPGVYQELAIAHLHEVSILPGQISGLSQLAKLSGMSISLNASGSGSMSSLGSIQKRRFMTAPLFVVTTFERSDGRGNMYTNTYTYEGAMIDLTGRGWLGFKKRLITDLEDNNKTVESYYLQFPFGLKIKERAKFRLSDSSFLTTTEHEYLDQNVPPGRIHTALKLKSTFKHFTFAADNLNPDYVCIEEYTYDLYGNIKQQSNLNSYADSSCNALYTNFEYDNDTINHRLGYVNQKKICSDEQLSQIISLVNFIRYPETMAIKTKIVWVKETNSSLEENRTYDDFGNVCSIMNYSKDTKRYTFDITTHNTYPTSVYYPPNSKGKVLEEKYTYDLRFGKKISFTDANGILRHSVLDDLGRVIENYGPSPSGDSFLFVRTTRTIHPSFGYCIADYVALDWISQKVKVQKKYYDGLHRVFKQDTFGQSGDEVSVVTRKLTEFDSKNRIVKNTLPFYEGEACVYTVKSFNPYGKLEEVHQPINSEQSFSTFFTYDSNTKITKRKISSNVYQTVKTSRKRFGKKDKIVNYVDGEENATDLYYDSIGRIKESVSPDNEKEYFEYDTANRKIVMNGNSFGQFKYIHDVVNRQLTIEDTDGKTSLYTSDPLGRLITLSYDPDIVFTFEYDSLDSKYGNFKLSTIQMEQSGNIIYTIKLDYYPNGSINQETLFIDGLQFITNYAYTPTKQIKSIIAPNGAEIKQEYTIDGLLEYIAFRPDKQAPWTIYAEYKNYNALIKPQLVSYPISGISNIYQYNDIGLVSDYKVENNGTVLHTDTFGFDDLARIKSKTGNIITSQYTYDNAGRLQSVINEPLSVNDAPYGKEDYTYHKSGNFISKGDNTFIYSDHIIKITNEAASKITEYEFDPQGNLLSKNQNGKVLNFDFDGFGNLTSVADDLAPLRSYYYTDKGIRLKTINHSKNQTYYQVNPWFKVIKNQDGSMTQELEIGGSTGIVANIVFSSPAGNSAFTVKDKKFIHVDHTNSVALVTNENGVVITKISYYPFGNVSELSGTDEFLKKFGSKEWDPETGLYYFNSRYYDPELGRFISPDTQITSNKLEHDVFNRYAFVLNDPINFQDPSGHGFLDWLLFIAGAIAAVSLGIFLPGAGEAVDAGLAVGLEAGDEAGADAIADIEMVDMAQQGPEVNMEPQVVQNEAPPVENAEIPENIANNEEDLARQNGMGDFNGLPNEMMQNISQYLTEPEDLTNFARTSTDIRDSLLDMRNPDTYDRLDNRAAVSYISRLTDRPPDEVLQYLDANRWPGGKISPSLFHFWGIRF